MNEEFKLPNGSYSVLDIQDFFKYIIKKHETFLITVTDHPTITIYANKTENRITFKIKTVYYLELLTPETLKLLASTKIKITKNENGENVPNLEITDVVLVHCHMPIMDINKIREYCIHFLPVNLLVNC